MKPKPSVAYQLLEAQEEERKRISRELHDVIAQTLVGINVRLEALKRDAAHHTKGLTRNIARTQKLVAHSVNVIHQFARELRPAMLDDLGLIPALNTYMKHFREETGIEVSLCGVATDEPVNGEDRTVLYRVAQEALTNVARHAHASRVDVSIQKRRNRVCMRIQDDGKSFNVAHTLHANGGKRLGLLGMRERLEMVGGSFDVVSAPGHGTTIEAQIPLGPAGHAGREDLAAVTG